jgi:methionyl-tRNA synthetase
MPEKFYVTTAIAYANSKPHMGHAYELVTTDIIARYKRLSGFDVYFLTGSDEHSINVQNKAKELGKDPKVYCDEMAAIYRDLWKKYNITNNDYIQTTEERHKKTVREIFKRIYDAGDIYKSAYEGWYCRSCEAYYFEDDLDADGNCPTHKTKPDWLKEENYFIRLSKYSDALLKLIQENPDFIQPETRKNEILEMIKGGLKDISVSRPKQEWGIKLPIDETQTVYVWFDALVNYISALGFEDGKGANFIKYWPADLHVIGKDITKFHCVIWPMMLMSAGIPLPKKIFGHGFLLNKGEKMSKTRGNIVDPDNVANVFGVEAIRYFFASHIKNGSDGDFSEDSLVTCYNTNLANDLGNLVNRTLNMVEKYFGAKVPAYVESTLDDPMKEAVVLMEKLWSVYESRMEALDFSEAMAETWKIIGKANKLIEIESPWNLQKEGKMEKLGTLMYILLEILRMSSVAILPVMPETAVKIWKKLGVAYDEKTIRLKDEIKFGKTAAGTTIEKGDPLFPRIEDEAKKAQNAAEPKEKKKKTDTNK